MKPFYYLFILLLTAAVAACIPETTLTPNVTATPVLTPIASTNTHTPEPTSTSTPIPTSTPTQTPQPNVELRFFYDWNLQDPFNLHGSGLNSKRDDGEPPLVEFEFRYAGEKYMTDEEGVALLLVSNTSDQITIRASNTNPYPGQKDLATLSIQFNTTMYEPHEVEYGPTFVIDLQDDNCQESDGRVMCEVGLVDGYITSPYKGENYLYSSPWTWDSGLSYEEHFVKPLQKGQVPMPGGGTYHLDESLGRLMVEYSNSYNLGVPYGYPYILNDRTWGVHAHMLMDIRNDHNVPVYAPIGGLVCQGNSSQFAICSGEIVIDINDIRAIPNWQYGLGVKRGQLIGWTDTTNNISGHAVPFPLIHTGNYEHRDRELTLSRFPYLTAEQIVMGATPDENGQIDVLPRDQVISNYHHKVHLPHAPIYIDE